MKNIQSQVNSNIRNYGSYSGKNRAPKPPSTGSSSKPSEISSYINSDNRRKNEQCQIFHTGQSSKSNSKSNSAQQLSRSKQKLREYPFYPQPFYPQQPFFPQPFYPQPFYPQQPFFPQDDMYNDPYINPGASGVGKTYPRDSRSIEIVPGWQEGGCGVTCVSMITGLNYKECRDVALTVGGFHPQGGMTLGGIAKTFQALGVDARLQPFRSWSDLPDLAVVGVYVTGIGHAVVFKRKNGKGYIFDRNQEVPLSPERYTIMGYQYVAIFK